MINNKTDAPAKKLSSHVSTLFSPQAGDYTFSHHASIAFFAGKFYAVWSNGIVNEDDRGQRVMLAVSSDGINWEKPFPIITPEALGDPAVVLSAGGMYADENALRIYFSSYTYAKASLINGVDRPRSDSSHENTSLGVIFTADGINWSQPKNLHMRMTPNHGPQKTSGGRLILTGNISFPYTDNPNAIDGYVRTGIYGKAFDEKEFTDDSESIRYVTSFNGWDVKLMCEGSFFETDDGVLHMLLRSNTEFLWCSESTDDGKTWSAPYKTGYTDDGSKFHFGRLPDGRFYGVSNATHGGGRNPLDLYLSSDGENFNKHYIVRDEPYTMQFPGLHKGGIYGYPHTMVRDGKMYVIYSKCKEIIEVTSFSIDELK